jgi:phosphohistidine phosphatase
MKTLLLLRHAKSSWDDPSLPDFDRPLAERGERDAPRIGRALAERGTIPELVISSTAVRAIQTAEKVTSHAKYEGELRLDPHIYGAGSAELMKVVRSLPGDYSTIMLVGHNPGFEDLLGRLTGTPQHMSTCNVACIGLEVNSWGNIEDGHGQLQWLLKPKSL